MAKNDTVGVGLIGAGIMGEGHAAATHQDPRAKLVGVASLEGAEVVAKRFGAEVATRDYREILKRTDIDLVIVATPDHLHYEICKAAIEAGKHVLVEKPLAMDADEVQEILAVSAGTGRFMMEAMWMRFNPLHTELKRRLDAGEFGRVVSIESDFSFEAPRDPAHRLFDPQKGGGALLDVGIYPLNLAWWWLGAPDSWAATGEIGPTGVDESVSMELAWADGATAVLTCGSTRDGSRTSTIVCEKATIVIAPPSHSSPVAEIRTTGSTEHVSAARPGLHHQVREVQRCAAEGLRESPRMPHSDSLAIARFMDDVARSLRAR